MPVHGEGQLLQFYLQLRDGARSCQQQQQQLQQHHHHHQRARVVLPVAAAAGGEGPRSSRGDVEEMTCGTAGCGLMASRRPASSGRPRGRRPDVRTADCGRGIALTILDFGRSEVGRGKASCIPAELETSPASYCIVIVSEMPYPLSMAPCTLHQAQLPRLLSFWLLPFYSERGSPAPQAEHQVEGGEY